MANKTILVVDDELDMRIFVSTVVETMGFEAMVAEDGVEAVEKAKLTPPALVILDVMMPKIDDGIQAYQKFKTDRRISHIPIIILSAIAKKTFFHSIRMLSSLKGSQLPEPHAYMEKPPDAGDLGNLIRRLLRTDKKFIEK